MQDDFPRRVQEPFRRRIDLHLGGEGRQIGFGRNAVVDLRGNFDLIDQPLGIIRAERLEPLRIRAVVVDRLGRIDGVAVALLLVHIEDAEFDIRLLELFERTRTLAARLGRHIARRREIGPVIARADIVGRRLVRHPSDRNVGSLGIGERRFHNGRISGADELDEVFGAQLRHDFARPFGRIDRILGECRRIGDVLDVEPQARTALLLLHLADEIFQRGELFAVGERAAGAQLGERMLPRMHAVDFAVSVGMGDDDVVVLRPVDVALGSVTAQIDRISQRSQRIVRRLALRGAAAVRDDVVAARRRFEQAVVDLFVGIGNLTPIGLRRPLVVGAGEEQNRCRCCGQ